MNETRPARPKRVSIVIPAYNEERHLAPCLKAIADQTSMPFEVIVVDNGSTDSTATIARAYSFVRVIEEPRRGIVHARNAGFNAARGDIIGRIDADIQLPPNWVAHIQSFYTDQQHLRQAWSGAGYFYNVRLPRLVAWTYSVFAFGLNKCLIGHYTIWGSNMAVTATQWRAIRHDTCNRLDIHEDLDLAIHLVQAGYETVYDKGIRTRAELRRVSSNRHKLWDYLQWWPRTLRVHGKRTWIICWFFGALMLYLAALLLIVLDWLTCSVVRVKTRLLGKVRMSATP